MDSCILIFVVALVIFSFKLSFSSNLALSPPCTYFIRRKQQMLLPQKPNGIGAVESVSSFFHVSPVWRDRQVVLDFLPPYRKGS